MEPSQHLVRDWHEVLGLGRTMTFHVGDVDITGQVNEVFLVGNSPAVVGLRVGQRSYFLPWASIRYWEGG